MTRTISSVRLVPYSDDGLEHGGSSGRVIPVEVVDCITQLLVEARRTRNGIFRHWALAIILSDVPVAIIVGTQILVE